MVVAGLSCLAFYGVDPSGMTMREREGKKTNTPGHLKYKWWKFNMAVGKCFLSIQMYPDDTTRGGYFLLLTFIETMAFGMVSVLTSFPLDWEVCPAKVLGSTVAGRRICQHRSATNIHQFGSLHLRYARIALRTCGSGSKQHNICQPTLAQGPIRGHTKG